MAFRIAILLCASLLVAEQTEPVLVSANIPKYPPLAAQGRIQGTVRLTFTLAALSAEPTKVEIVSGPPFLNGAAVVKTWRFDNAYNVERKYETTFEYRLSGKEVDWPQDRKLTVSSESFHKVEIVTDLYKETVNY